MSVAFRALAPLLCRSLARLPVIIGLAAAGSLAVEILQYVLGLGRLSSIDDVLLNAAGAGLGGLVTRRCLADVDDGTVAAMRVRRLLCNLRHVNARSAQVGRSSGRRGVRRGRIERLPASGLSRGVGA